jgi:hypothetical protein
MIKILLFLMSTFALDCHSKPNTKVEETRDPLKWPFAQTSIWNMPIGSHAKYVHAYIEKAMAAGMTIDEDYIVMTPDVPLVDIFENFSGWDRTKNRCTIEGKHLFSAPIPQSFVVSPETWDGETPNAGLAVLMQDRRTIKQTQPFAHCEAGSPATSQYLFDDVDIYGDGTYGAHGGSGLSAIGGTLRIGELTPSSDPIRHVMKVNLFSNRNIYYDRETYGYRWPARNSDDVAPSNYYKNRRSKIVKACRMGALLALPAKMDLDALGFETRPARILAEAFQNYGAYLVDDAGWDVYAIATEWSPEGRFDDEFKRNWGFSMKADDKDSPWARDMDRIFLNLHVVENNSPSTPGGGGKTRQPLAPPFKD